jgi:tetratricopeptide (TPR) repeat protein
MGRILNQTNHQAQAIHELNRALTLNQNLASAHAIIGLAKLYDGHPEETESHELEALRASPRDTDAYFWVGRMAEAKLYLGAYEDALNLCHRSIELNRNYPERFTYCAAILVELGRLDEGEERSQSRARPQSRVHHPPLPRRRAKRQSAFLEATRADHRGHAQGGSAGGVNAVRS